MYNKHPLLSRKSGVSQQVNKIDPSNMWKLGISLLDDLEHLKTQASPSVVLRTMLMSRFSLHSFSFYSVNRDRKVVSDLLTDKTVLMREETPFIKAMPVGKSCPEFQVFGRPEFDDGWTYIVPDEERILVLYVEDRRHLETVDLYALNFLTKIWYSQKKKQQFEDRISHFEEQIRKIRNIGEHLAKEHKFKQLLSSILLDAMEMVGAAKGHIMTYDNDKQELKLQIVHGMANPEIDQLINDGKIPMQGIKPGQGIQGKVFQSGESIKLDEITDHQDMGADEDIHSIICVPLRMNEVTYGVLYVTNKHSGLPFSETDLDLISILSANVAAVMDQEKLFKESVTDHLTGLFTRRYFEPKLDSELLRSVRYDRPVSILAIDADRFKNVNDTYGHQAGDAVLQRLATVMNSCLRHKLDVSARFGGEEFFVFLPETDSQGAFVVAERIRNTMEATHIHFEEYSIQITLSIGIACAPNQAKTSEELIKLADEALYMSKQSGRNQTTIYQS